MSHTQSSGRVDPRLWTLALDTEVTAREAAALLGRSVSGLADLRSEGRGPAYHQPTGRGGRLRYVVGALQEWAGGGDPLSALSALSPDDRDAARDFVARAVAAAPPLGPEATTRVAAALSVGLQQRAAAAPAEIAGAA